MAHHQLDEIVSIAIPDEWEIWEPAHGDLFVAAATEIGEDDLQPHVIVTRSETENRTARSCLINAANILSANHNDYVEHSARTFDLPNGMTIARLVYDATVAELDVTNIEYFLVLNGREYSLVCRMLPEQRKRWTPRFDDIVHSLTSS